MNKLFATTAMILALTSAMPAAAEHHEGKMDILQTPKMQQVLAGLPAEKSAMVKEKFAALKASNETKWEKMKADHEALKAMLTADTFDKSAYLAKAKAMTEEKTTNAMRMHETVADIASGLTKEERVSLMDAMPDKGEGMSHRKPGEKPMHGDMHKMEGKPDHTMPGKTQ